MTNSKRFLTFFKQSSTVTRAIHYTLYHCL
jgi:hypothetical protein